MIKKSIQLFAVLGIFIIAIGLIFYRTLEIAKNPADQRAVDAIVSVVSLVTSVLSMIFGKKSGKLREIIKALAFSTTLIPVALLAAHIYINNFQ